MHAPPPISSNLNKMGLFASKQVSPEEEASVASESSSTIVAKPVGGYVDPPMPTMGNPVNFDLLVDRNKNVKMALETMMVYVERDVERCVKEAQTVPVSTDTERVIVQEDTMNRMAQARTIKESKASIKHNLEMIQRALIYRKSSLEMMNANYAKKVVRKVDKVDLRETRSILDAK